MGTATEHGKFGVLVRTAVVLAVIGLLCSGVLLVFGAGPWTVGVSMMLGAPILGLAILLYLVVVIRDLRDQGIL